MSEERMYPLQAMLNGMSAEGQRKRGETQMTLGQLIGALEKLPPTMPIKGLGRLRSYRGYYSDLAFEPTEESCDVATLLTHCRGAMGQIFEGYKGGDYMMGYSTPLWVSGYGTSSGMRVMGLDIIEGNALPNLEMEE